MKTLLFAPENFNIAETTRMIEIARACGDDFHCEFFGYGGEYEHLIREAGFVCHTLSPRLTPQRVEELWKADRMERGGKFFTHEEMTERVRNELALYAKTRPTAVVIGFTLSTFISARAAKIPLVSVNPLALTGPFFQANPTVWGKMLHGTPLGWLPGGLVNRAINAWGRRTKLWTKPMNRVAKEFGVRPFTSLTDIFRGDHTLVTDIPQLTGVPDLPPTWRYVGPIYAKLEGDVPPEIANLPHDQPIIYFAMGSSANREVLVRVMQMFAAQPYRVIAPIKRHLAGLDVAVPDNVQVFDWLPAHKVNPLADVAVIHGGQGTVQTACVSGTPFLGIGLQPEQDINVLQAAQFGSALHLNRYALNEERVLTAVHRLLTHPTFGQKAAELRDELAKWPGAANVAAFLREKFLAVTPPEEIVMSSEFQQKDAGFLTYPSGGWRKAMFKWPVQLWRLGLGPLMGQVFVLITTTGRKSGLPRRTLTEYHRLNGRKYAPSGFGRRSQWYRNIEADPHVTIQTADGAQSVIARRVTDDQEILDLVRIMEKKDGKMLRDMYLDALDIAYNDADILAKKDRIYWLRFDPTDEPTPPPLQADLVWVWPVVAVIGLIKLALWRVWRKRHAN